MKSCLNRPTIVVIIGNFYILANIMVGIYFTMVFLDLRELQVNGQSKATILAKNIHLFGLIWCCGTVVLSILMVVGVIMNQYRLMTPYIYLGVIGMVCSVFVWLVVVCACIVEKIPAQDVVLMMVRAAFVTAFQLLLWLPVYRLYKEWQTTSNAAQSAYPEQELIQNFIYQDVYGVQIIPAIVAKAV